MEFTVRKNKNYIYNMKRKGPKILLCGIPTSTEHDLWRTPVTSRKLQSAKLSSEPKLIYFINMHVSDHLSTTFFSSIRLFEKTTEKRLMIKRIYKELNFSNRILQDK